MERRHQIGIFGEKLAQKYLERQGYRIIKTNIKISYKEIDLVAAKDQILIFVEVKTRTSNAYGVASEAMDFRKTANFSKAIELYLGAVDAKKDFRADLIAVDININNKTAKIKHYQGVI